ncbi:MAG TPA: sodium:proton antiporter, partial [Cytophagales bacterium]|nr:sodium:proton antiporter [Cytophagales bacterium]
MSETQKPVRFIHQLLPLLFLATLIGYGLVWLPLGAGRSALPLELVFLLAACFSIGHLLIIGYPWKAIEGAILQKITKGFPAVLILFAIGIIIGAWMVSGTIPMLVYWGIRLIDPRYLYALAFFIPILFSLMTGTSWGSVGTIGVVIIGVGQTVQADLGIVAGAIIGGAYFGDKLSPLSDSTNLAAIATEVPLYTHIRSMLYTTLPSALVAFIVFTIMGWVRPAAMTEVNSPEVTAILTELDRLFRFNVLLLLPPLVVLVGSLKRWPTLPVLLGSAVLAILIGLIFQPYGLSNTLLCLVRGFHTDMAAGSLTVSETVQNLVNRGGMYQLNEAIMFTLMVYLFIGSLDLTQAMPGLVTRVFGWVKSRRGIVLATLGATAFTNATTSNQAATSFVVG